MHIKISPLQGKIFSKNSSDVNQIHLNDTSGYNSIFSEKICHASKIEK